MKQTTRIAIAALLHSAGSVLTALAAEFNGGDDKPQETAATPEEEKPKRGRKAAAAAQPETPAESAALAQPETPAVTGKTYEELKAIIKPVVEAGQGAEVKAVIAKFAENLKALEGKPEHHEAFEKEIAALVY